MRNSKGERLLNTIHPLGTYWLVGEGKPRPVTVLRYEQAGRWVQIRDHVRHEDRIVPRKMLAREPRRFWMARRHWAQAMGMIASIPFRFKNRRAA